MKKIFKYLALLIAVSLCAAIIATGYFAYNGYRMYKEAVSQKSIAEMAEDIKNRCDFRTYDELPEFYVNAVICTEDRSFFTHGGIDISAICRAIIHDIKVKAPEQGGSTITQQLAKNEYFTQEKKLQRKFAEIFAAFDIEKQLSKEDIFALYVNSIYFGSGYNGITEAAQGYCGKEVSALDEYECALLAGLPNAPSAYSPDASPRLAERRTEIVLENMTDCGKISRATADKLITAHSEAAQNNARQ